LTPACAAIETAFSPDTLYTRNQNEDVRFTAKGATLYAFVMGWPEREAVIKSLASAGKVANVELLGFKGKLQWSQDEAGLKVAMPAEKPCEHAIVLKIAVA
jgi:alpha-L-fucosidase